MAQRRSPTKPKAPKGISARAPKRLRAADLFPEIIPAHLRTLIDLDDPQDPLALQFRADSAEIRSAPEDTQDPIGDQAHEKIPGLVHRYPDRVLIKPVLACPVHCRFCFRRDQLAGDAKTVLDESAFARIISYITMRPSVFEAILTGGEPLLLSPKRLGGLLDRLAEIPHLRTLRVHTRLPIAGPKRITKAMIDSLKPHHGKPVWLAIHCNHSRELAPETRQAIARLADAGIPLLAQTVLLRGVNDDIAALDSLFRDLTALRVKPYYLHQCDLVPGAAHFRVSLAKAQKLDEALRARLSGIARPTLVLDIPGGAGKLPAGKSSIKDNGSGQFTLKDVRGRKHAYPPKKSKKP